MGRSSKQARLILVVLSACSLVSIDAAAGGVCFDVADVGNIDAHFRQIKSKFSAVRVYETQMGSTNAIVAAAKAGLQIAAGVWIRSGDAKVQADIDAIAAGIKAHPDTVVAVYVGNEDLSNGVSEQTVVARVNQVKASLSRLGVPVGSVQVDGDFLGAGALAAACDVVGVNIYPFFGSSPDSISRPIYDLNTRWMRVTAKYGGKAKLTETGWPTTGTYNGHVGNFANAKAYWESYSEWSYGNGGGIPFYFQHRDIAGKAPEYEAHFGLVDGSGNWKFDVAPPPSSPTSPPTPPPTPPPTFPPTPPPTSPPTSPPTPPPTPPPTSPPTSPPTEPPTPPPTSPPTEPPTTAPPTTTEASPPATTAAPTDELTTATPEAATTLEPTTIATTSFVELTETNSTAVDAMNNTFANASATNDLFTASAETLVSSSSDGATNSADAPVVVGSGGSGAAGGVAGSGAAGSAAGAPPTASDSTSIGSSGGINASVSSADSSTSNPAPTIFLSAGCALAVAATALFVVRRRAQSLEEGKDAFDPEFGLDSPQTAVHSSRGGDYPKQPATAQATSTPVATQTALTTPQQPCEPSLFNPKDSLFGVAMLEDRPSTMLDTMDDIRESEDYIHESISDDDAASLDNRPSAATSVLSASAEFLL
ncbi:hypothetical protein H310_13186 [Aphanomyces invadans]|uniref:glucan endo-1,3-beta-D-glucosidase n=1 Tax=Aphanomyces invadans TaxID=157072 RepID=A0A024TFY2_9STRA|nr:hypothetical protein H310_13186 [Aphanomyces invadans]ETV92501.1 hypothetical protein H310_13186 [Aphanomyces invadans]|eukprot:XP_008878808.1 hypothetical protein H310_13186 [Aphanomyces invadans]